MNIKIGIVGTTSMSAGILIKLLLNHKHAEIKALVSDNFAGKKVHELHKNLAGMLDKQVIKHDTDELANTCDVIFFCKQPGESIDRITELVKNKNNKKLKFIDLSADYRMKDVALYPKWYGFEHKNPELLKDAVYGLPELYADKIKSAYLIANPGCYATAVILSLAPLLKSKTGDNNSIICDAFSGVSGAGRNPNERNMAYNVEGNILPYKIGNHQHTPEIEQELNNAGNTTGTKVLLIPHVVQFKYGIFATSMVKLAKKTGIDEIYGIYEKFYSGKKFVRILKENDYPEIRNVEGTNFCDISIKLFNEYAVVMSAIDNVVKGASGQAIQNMNLMFGLPETEGLLTHL